MQTLLIGLAMTVASSAMGAALVPGDTMSLCTEGDGQWDVRIRRGREQDGLREIVVGMPRGMCVDNRGGIYVCDSFASRILRFTTDGRPLQEITHPELRGPIAIEVDREDVLLIEGGLRQQGDQILLEMDVSGSTPAFSRLEVDAVVVDAVLAENPKSHSLAVAPLGTTGLRYMRSTGGEDSNLVVIDRANQYVKSVPSRFFDVQGRYYKPVPPMENEAPHAMGVFDESGQLIGRFSAPSGPFVKLQGWVYFLDMSDDKAVNLKRYASDGLVEDAIALVGYERGERILTSPDGRYILGVRRGFVQGRYEIRVRWYTYGEQSEEVGLRE